MKKKIRPPAPIFRKQWDAKLKIYFAWPYGGLSDLSGLKTGVGIYEGSR